MWRWWHFMLRFAQKSRQNELNIPNCALLVFKSGNTYLIKWTCVYRINFKIRNSKIQENYTAKVKVVRESPICVQLESALIHLQSSVIELESFSHSIKELTNTDNTPTIWKNVRIRELSNSIREICYWIGELSNCTHIESSLVQNESSPIQFESP